MQPTVLKFVIINILWDQRLRCSCVYLHDNHFAIYLKTKEDRSNEGGGSDEE